MFEQESKVRFLLSSFFFLFQKDRIDEFCKIAAPFATIHAETRDFELRLHRNITKFRGS